MTLDWDHFYILGWYDDDGRPYLTSWAGDRPIVHVVITGVRRLPPPLCFSPVPPGCEIHAVPDGVSPQAHARAIGGMHVMGWCLEEKIERRAP